MYACSYKYTYITLPGGEEPESASWTPRSRRGRRRRRTPPGCRRSATRHTAAPRQSRFVGWSSNDFNNLRFGVSLEANT